PVGARGRDFGVRVVEVDRGHGGAVRQPEEEPAVARVVETRKRIRVAGGELPAVAAELEGRPTQDGDRPSRHGVEEEHVRDTAPAPGGCAARPGQRDLRDLAGKLERAQELAAPRAPDPDARVL